MLCRASPSLASLHSFHSAGKIQPYYGQIASTACTNCYEGAHGCWPLAAPGVHVPVCAPALCLSCVAQLPCAAAHAGPRHPTQPPPSPALPRRAPECQPCRPDGRAARQRGVQRRRGPGLGAALPAGVPHQRRGFMRHHAGEHRGRVKRQGARHLVNQAVGLPRRSARRLAAAHAQLVSQPWPGPGLHPRRIHPGGHRGNG